MSVEIRRDYGGGRVRGGGRGSSIGFRENSLEGVRYKNCFWGVGLCYWFLSLMFFWCYSVGFKVFAENIFVCCAWLRFLVFCFRIVCLGSSIVFLK